MVITRPAVTVLVLCLASTLAGAPKAPSSARAKQATARAKTATSSSSSQKKVAWRRPVPRKPSAPASPASDRIRLLQLALIERGYLQSDPTGSITPQTVEAIKKFEADQKWKVDGKIDSRILIALGLGPKYDANLPLPVPSGYSSSSVAADQSPQNEPQRN